MTREDKKALWHSPLVITYKTHKTIRMHLHRHKMVAWSKTFSITANTTLEYV